MKEIDFINIIKNQVGERFIGDDCAYLKDFGIVVTQDNLVEDIHFKKEWYTAFQLGYKAVIVNISDVIAAGALPKYVTIGLSIPSYINDKFINEFYLGAKSALHGAKIIGGDITGADKIFISITAIGETKGRRISSRKYAKEGYVIVTEGNHGSSSAGLKELLTGGSNKDLIAEHIMPRISINLSEYISKNIEADYAMMDTSDGLMDALYKIAESSGVKIIANYEMIPHRDAVEEKDILFGGEGYKLIAAVPEQFAMSIPNCSIIGKVVKYDGTRVEIGNKKYNKYDDLDLYNHFGEE